MRCHPLLKQIAGDGTGTHWGGGRRLRFRLSSVMGWAVTASLRITWSLKAGFSLQAEMLNVQWNMRAPDLLNLAHEKRRPGTHYQGKPKHILPSWAETHVLALSRRFQFRHSHFRICWNSQCSQPPAQDPHHQATFSPEWLSLLLPFQLFSYHDTRLLLPSAITPALKVPHSYDRSCWTSSQFSPTPTSMPEAS